MEPSHDLKKIKTTSYRFSGYQMKRVKTQDHNFIVDSLPDYPTTPYGNLTERANSTPYSNPSTTIQSGNIKK